MLKKLALPTIVVFVAWSLMDFVIHVVILSESYGQTASLWRPEAEMKMGLMSLVVFISALILVYIYSKFVADKSTNTAMQFGTLMGLSVGLSFAYGSYAVMPLPYYMAMVWFLGSLVEGLVAGVILGYMVKD